MWSDPTSFDDGEDLDADRLPKKGRWFTCRILCIKYQSFELKELAGQRCL